MTKLLPFQREFLKAVENPPLDSGADVDANHWILRRLPFPPHLP